MVPTTSRERDLRLVTLCGQNKQCGRTGEAMVINELDDEIAELDERSKRFDEKSTLFERERDELDRKWGALRHVVEEEQEKEKELSDQERGALDRMYRVLDTILFRLLRD